MTNSKKKVTKEILFLTATHGDEGFSIELLKKLDEDTKNKNYDWLVVNEKALRVKKRYIDCDLNRSAPGNPRSEKYEEQRAAEILKTCQNYKYVIDLHSTKAETGIFVIVTNPSPENLKLAASLPIKKVVIWANDKPNGPITQFVSRGVEIECGPRDSQIISDQLFLILRNLISINLLNKRLELDNKEFYQVVRKLNYQDINELDRGRLREFQLVDINSESFYPLLIGRYPDSVCIKLKQVDFSSILSVS